MHAKAVNAGKINTTNTTNKIAIIKQKAKLNPKMSVVESSFCHTRHRGDLKNFTRKEWISGILFFDGERSRSRSHNLVLRSLRILTGQQRFYGTGLVVAREGISTPNAPYLR
jgi:hypothetical protein